MSTLFVLEVHTLYRNPENRNLFVTKNHHRLTSETMFKWRFAGGPIVAIEMAFRWRADDGQNLHAGLVAL